MTGFGSNGESGLGLETAGSGSGSVPDPTRGALPRCRGRRREGPAL
jgi:hypothetical protein